MNHQGKHTHLGSTALVEFLSTVVVLCFFGVSSNETNGEGRGGEVSRVGAFGSVLEQKDKQQALCVSFSTTTNRTCTECLPCAERDLLLPSGKFKGTAEGKDLKGTWNGDSERGIPTRAKVRELGSIGGDVTGEVDTGLVHQVTDDTKHADASVLELNVTKAIELFLITIGNKAKGIPVSKGNLSTNLIFEGAEGRGCGGLLGGGKGGSRGKEGGENSELHLENVLILELCHPVENGGVLLR